MDFSKITVRNLDGIVSFCPTAKQKLYLNAITESNLTSILTRQQGFSTVQIIAIIRNAIDNPGSASFFISHNNRINVHKMDTVREMLHDMGKHDEILRANSNRIELMNGSTITITSLTNASKKLLGYERNTLFVAIDLIIKRNNLYEVSLLVQMLVQMNARFSIGLMLTKPVNVSKKVMKIFNVKLTILMTMLRYNTTFIDFPVLEHKDRPFLSPDPYKQEYELFGYSVLDEDPTDHKLEPCA